MSTTEKRASRQVATRIASIPLALEQREAIRRRLKSNRLAVFLDYDGTLTPIVERPELAVMPEDTRATVARLARLCKVAIVSGRDRADVEKLVRLESVFYAGSHGFDISGPGPCRMEHEEGTRLVPVLRQAADQLSDRLEPIDGAAVERKKYAIAVHYRRAAEQDVEAVERAVDEVVAVHQELRKTGGKKVFELRPRVPWDKGKAVLWLLKALDLEGPDVLGIYLGDDVTDEDAFAVLRDRGIAILVGHEPRPTQARYRLRDPSEVKAFLDDLIVILEGARP